MARKKINPELNNLMDFYKRFPDEKSCREYLVNERFPDGKVACPKCSGNEKIYKLKDDKRYKCGNCKHIFTITVGTIFEASHIPLQKWFLTLYIISAHKKGISSLQLSRDIGVTQKSAWFMLHRIREMLKGIEPYIRNGTVEIDETYIGGKEGFKHKSKRQKIVGYVNKAKLFAMLHREGDVWTKQVEETNGKALKPIIRRTIDKSSKIISDGFGAYYGLSKEYEHEIINHEMDEWARGDIHTNTIEGFFSLLKRGIVGIYHHVSPKHLNRYSDEYSYRYNTRRMKDGERFKHTFSLCGARLKYKELIAA